MRPWLSKLAWLSPQRCLDRAGMRPPMQMTIGLVLLTASILLFAKALGLFPNSEEALLQRRTMLSEMTALNAASVVSNDNQAALRDFLKTVVRRYDEILSIGLRREDGSILVETLDHEQNWANAQPYMNTPTHIQVPLFENQKPWGHLEISFKAPSRPSTWIAWWRTPLVQPMVFILLAAFLFFWIYLSRMLRQLDPAGAIPQRIQLLMDTMVEGVVILDEQGQIVLTNQSFADTTFSPMERLIGKKLSSLPWLSDDGRGAPDQYPWNTMEHDNLQQRGILLRLQIGTRHNRRLTINTSPIFGPDGAHCGTLVTFNDQTVIESENIRLTELIKRLGRANNDIRQFYQQLPPTADGPQIARLEELARATAELEQLCNSPAREIIDLPEGSEPHNHGHLISAGAG
jgi:PAS domain-containing protein